MESERLALKLIPQSGGKIQCIYDKAKGKEYLHQREGDEYIFSQYASRYVNGEMSRLDEIFMSVDESFYPSWPWKGITYPTTVKFGLSPGIITSIKVQS